MVCQSVKGQVWGSIPTDNNLPCKVGDTWSEELECIGLQTWYYWGGPGGVIEIAKEARVLRKRKVPWTCIVEEFASRWKDYESNLSIAEKRKLTCLLQKPTLPLRECHLPRRYIHYFLDRYLLSHHFRQNQEHQKIVPYCFWEWTSFNCHKLFWEIKEHE